MSELSATHLVKRYQGRTAVDNVSLRVASGEVVGLLGPNGAGKTTCFYMMVGLLPCDSGQINLDNVDITRQPMHQRARRGVGYLPQEASVFRQLSVADNIMAILEIRPDMKSKQRR
ncbi:MAG: ATP-binding cassette domain-containing protein, partial [Gammaproteobacteria bacterium]